MRRAILAILGSTFLTMVGVGCDSRPDPQDMKVENITPREGTVKGQQPVRIIGKNFRRDLGYTVVFGSRRATDVTVLDEETLVVNTPSADEAGKVDVFVSSDSGPAFRMHKAFRYAESTRSIVEQLGAQQGKKKAAGSSKLAY